VSLQLIHTKPTTIEAKARFGQVSIEEFAFELNVFLTAAQKALVGEVMPWKVPQVGRGAKSVPMRAVLKGKNFQCVKLGSYTISFQDFLCLIQYVLVNTNLTTQDPRLPFISFVKTIDNTRSYMTTKEWELFVEGITALKKVRGFSAVVHGKDVGTNAWRLSPV
jgi:hypothetical protein